MFTYVIISIFLVLTASIYAQVDFFKLNSFSDYFSFSIFIFLTGMVLFCLRTVMKDKKQRDHAILRNFPLFGHIRYMAESLRKFVQPWILENDNEGGPFNRATRSKVYRMAKGIDNVLSFGSTSSPKTELFANAMFPLEAGDADAGREVVVGKDCSQPFLQKKLFSISGMSFGALSGNAIEALSKGAAKAGMTMNTGEGGKPSRYHMSEEMLDAENGAGIVLQIGTSNFGYRKQNGKIDYEKLSEVGKNPVIKWVQLKLSQGAKPGKGGILPGSKVTQEIAELRGVEEGVDCISPSKNPDCGDLTSLLETIKKIKVVTGKPVGVKLAIAKIDELRILIYRALEMDVGSNDSESHLPSVITIDGGDGGTGAAPAVFMESLAVPVRDVLVEVNEMLIKCNVRSRVALVASGKLVTSHDVAMAFAMGADWVESARGFMMSIGCINALECASGKCPVGIATQDKKLQSALDPDRKSLNVYNYAVNMEKEVFAISLSCGVSHPRDLSLEHMVLPRQISGKSIIARFKDAS